MEKCQYCESENIKQKVILKASGHTICAIGRKKPDGWLSDSTELLLDVCQDCGSVLRFYFNKTFPFWDTSDE